MTVCNIKYFIVPPPFLNCKLYTQIRLADRVESHLVNLYLLRRPTVNAIFAWFMLYFPQSAPQYILKYCLLL